MSEGSNFPVFKRATLEDTSVVNKKRAWKSLKQILATERTLQWLENAVTCMSMYTYYNINSIQFLKFKEYKNH